MSLKIESDVPVIQTARAINSDFPLNVGSSGNTHTLTGNLTVTGTLSAGAESVTSQIITAASANAFTVGRQGTTNPQFNVDTSTASVATGLNVKGAAAAGGLALSVITSGTNESATFDAAGTGTLGFNTLATNSGLVTIGNSTSLAGIAVNGPIVGTSASATALAVGRLGSTTPAFSVDASTASQVAGLNIKGAATGGTVAIAAIDSGSNTGVTIDGKGTGTIGLNTVSTTSGLVTIGNSTAVGGVLVNGPGTIASASATSFTIGPNGSTNPAFKVDSSAGSLAAGVLISGNGAGFGVSIAAISSGSNEVLNINAKGNSQLKINNTGVGQVSIGRGIANPIIQSSTTTALGTVQNTTPTAAQILGGILTQTSATGAGTVTLPTGTQLSAAINFVAVGDTLSCLYANLGGGQTVTITGQTGSTVIGNAAIPTGKNALMTFVNTGSNAWNVYVTISA